MLQEPLRVELLGELRIVTTSQSFTRFRTRKAAVLLAFLAYHSRRAHPREQLIEMLWPDAEVEAGRTSFRTALASLRRQLEIPGIATGSVLMADNAFVQINPAAVVTDVAEFEEGLRRAALVADRPDKIARYMAAVELYRGELLPGYYEEWALIERTFLADLYQKALSDMVALLEQSDRMDEAIKFARRAVAADVSREDAHETLMRLYVGAGQPGLAMRQFQELESVLREEFGTTPSAEARALVAGVLADSAARADRNVTPPPGRLLDKTTKIHNRSHPPPSQTRIASDTETAATLDGPTSMEGLSPRLPVQFTRFFGREDELARLQPLLSSPETRLVSLTGPGGSGKTRIAVTLGARLLTRYAGAVCFVSLADVWDAAHIPAEILNALRLPPDPDTDPMEQVISTLSSQSCLLILDNLEQFDARGAELIKTLLERAPLLTCLVTSRRRLNIEGENAFPVQPLPIPMQPESPERLLEFAGIQLFVDRARLARPDFQITPRNAGVVAALCAKLEGVPLAIELAAAWSLLLSPAAILSRMGRRFEILVSRQKDAASRHHTLWAAIDWSYNLLSPELRKFVTRLSVFRGGWTLEAADCVCLDARSEEDANAAPETTGEGIGSPPAPPTSCLEILMQLRERSLILADEGADEGTARFRMLESLREFASEQLDPRTRDRLARHHADCFLRFAETANVPAAQRDSPTTRSIWQAEQDNFRAAFEWSLGEGGDPTVALRLGVALSECWWHGGYWTEGHYYMQRALAQAPGAPSGVQAEALNWMGSLANYRGESLSARDYYRRARDAYLSLNDADGAAMALQNLGFAALGLNDNEEAAARFEEGLHYFRAAGKVNLVANSLVNLSDVACRLGQYDRARDMLREMMQLMRGRGMDGYIALGMAGLGEIAYYERDYAVARTYLEQSVAQFRAGGEVFRVAQMLVMLGRAALEHGDVSAATAAFQESLPILCHLGSTRDAVGTLEELARCALANSQPERAARLLSAAYALRLPPSGAAPTTGHRGGAKAPDPLEQARAELGVARFAEAWAPGQTMTLAQAVVYALDTPP